MFEETEQSNMQTVGVGQRQDVAAGAECLWDSLGNGQLARRIMAAAQLAVNRHMLLAAPTMRPWTEAEDSAPK